MLLPHARQAACLTSGTRRSGKSILSSLIDARQTACCSSPAMGVAEQAAATDSEQQAPAQHCSSSNETEQAVDAGGQPVKKKVKRNVALHVGYVGTAYTGLQANRELPQLQTIEGVLEKAILQAGLISEANFGDFRRTKWTRSSRTDKGVHSLCTVIGLRILMDDQTYHTDPEGTCYAHAINQHLPPDVRVFCVQRTNKSFNARRWCGSRTYEYYLPAAALGLDSPDGSSPEDQARLALLREVLDSYVGYKPFQNYAGNRRQYVGQKAKAARKRQKREERKAAEEAAAAAAAAGMPEPQEQQQQEEEPAAAADVNCQACSSDAAAGAASDNVSTADTAATATTTAEESEESEGMDAEEVAQYEAAKWEYSGEGPVPPALLFQQQVRFLSAPDPDDPVVKSHYRLMRSFTAGDPRPLVEGGVPCLRLEVCGDSFMLHQIRHMIGAAVAVVRGIMPRELVEVSLSAPGRVTLPRAPPHTLLLSGSLFSPFPSGWGHDTPLVARWTGDRLQLREAAKQELLQFRQQVFDPALNDLLQHPDWETWSRKLLPRYHYAPEDVAPAVQSHAVWLEQLKAKRAAAAAAKAAEAAEAAAAKAATESSLSNNTPSSRLRCTIM